MFSACKFNVFSLLIKYEFELLINGGNRARCEVTVGRNLSTSYYSHWYDCFTNWSTLTQQYGLKEFSLISEFREFHSALLKAFFTDEGVLNLFVAKSKSVRIGFQSRARFNWISVLEVEINT